jgi:hypothetical protein
MVVVVVVVDDDDVIICSKSVELLYVTSLSR